MKSKINIKKIFSVICILSLILQMVLFNIPRSFANITKNNIISLDSEKQEDSLISRATSSDTINIMSNKQKLKDIIKEVSVKENDLELFGAPKSEFNKPNFKIKLEYDFDTYGNINKGDELLVSLVPEDVDKNFLDVDYTATVHKDLRDGLVKVGDLYWLDHEDATGVKITFENVATSFTVDINIPLEYNAENLLKYFEKPENKDKPDVDFKYRLKYNDEIQDKTLEFTIKNPRFDDIKKKFSKTIGVYNQEGELGQGYILYNIWIGSNLSAPNEMIIYDTPDVNLSFDGTMSIHRPVSYGKATDRLFSNKNEWKGEGLDDGMEIYISDIYFLTEPEVGTKPRQSAYKEEKIKLDRNNLATGENFIESAKNVVQPKNILLEKPMGDVLNEAEKELIEANGGLYKKVGKGFKVRIKNFKDSRRNKGGYLNLIYELNIKNPSPSADEGIPIYYNTASYYAQEIPNTKSQPGDASQGSGLVGGGINTEEVTLEDIVRGRYTTKAEIRPSSIQVNVDKYSRVNFKKLELGADANPNMNKPLEGAIFNIYKLENDGSRQIAINKDNISLQNLKTNADGYLCKNDGTPVDLRLIRGKYIFEEVKAPDNYDIINKDTEFVVGYSNNNLYIANAKSNALKYNAKYRFISITENKNLPDTVLRLLPNTVRNIINGTIVEKSDPANYEVSVSDGKWVFVSWDRPSKRIENADVEFIGSWKFINKNDIVPNSDNPNTTPSYGTSSGGNGGFSSNVVIVSNKKQKEDKKEETFLPGESNVGEKQKADNPNKEININKKVFINHMVPKTYDHSKTGRFIFILVISILLLSILTFNKYKKRK